MLPLPALWRQQHSPEATKLSASGIAGVYKEISIDSHFIILVMGREIRTRLRPA